MEKYYRHFKGGLYKLVGIAKDSETLEDLVVYQAMYGDRQLWVRPAGMFFGKVERDGKVMDRFEEIGEECIPSLATDTSQSDTSPSTHPSSPRPDA